MAADQSPGQNRSSPLAWWRHQMETFSALLALCVGKSPVTGEFHSKRPVTRSFDVLFDLLICAWTNGWANNRYAGDLIRHRAHYDAIVMEFPLFRIIFCKSVMGHTITQGNGVLSNLFGVRPTWILVLHASLQFEIELLQEITCAGNIKSSTIFRNNKPLQSSGLIRISVDIYNPQNIRNNVLIFRDSNMLVLRQLDTMTWWRKIISDHTLAEMFMESPFKKNYSFNLGCSLILIFSWQIVWKHHVLSLLLQKPQSDQLNCAAFQKPRPFSSVVFG